MRNCAGDAEAWETAAGKQQLEASLQAVVDYYRAVDLEARRQQQAPHQRGAGHTSSAGDATRDLGSEGTLLQDVGEEGSHSQPAGESFFPGDSRTCNLYTSVCKSHQLGFNFEWGRSWMALIAVPLTLKGSMHEAAEQPNGAWMVM